MTILLRPYQPSDRAAMTALLLDRDRARRIAFEVRARNVYFDMQPIVQRYRRTAPVVR